LETYQIHIDGIVQGVGFRPVVYLVASEMGIKGIVKNDCDGLNIFFNASQSAADEFFRKIKSAAPLHSKILSASINRITDQLFPDFKIVVEENDNSEKKVLMTPDVAICPECKIELHDSESRRYRYPFITCTNCGPRYSIINNIPFERHQTAMQPFTMCQTCNDEYHNVNDRRFFSQTNSCSNCGVQLSFIQKDLKDLSYNSEQVLSLIKKHLIDGKIIAVKGIGGYLLMCDADNIEAIQQLRIKKHRPKKPLALLFPDLTMLTKCCEVNYQEKKLLQSAEAPIVLLKPRKSVKANFAFNEVSPGLNRVGVMLPCTPLLDLIAKDFGGPIVATSANISGSPIIYEDQVANNQLFEIADFVVSYNRDIVIPLDDSVVQVSRYENHQLILRRSRGYAPSHLPYKPKSSGCILATGAFMKSSFTLAINGNVFISQFLGSGECYESQLMYKQTLRHWLNMYNAQPELIVADEHPQYFSNNYALELAEEFGAKLQLVQHHEAHFAAVLAENDLLATDEQVLGVIWDGTGLGDDGNIWGGEFFTWHQEKICRVSHFDYFPVIAGDKMARDPRISALCLLNAFSDNTDFIKNKFTETEWSNYSSLLENHQGLFSSSVGRLFDAVACLLDVCNLQSYEGEAAMALQVLAENYVEDNGFLIDESYFEMFLPENKIPVAKLILGILKDIETGKQKEYIAAKFHYSLVGLVASIARKFGISNICFSGGVFQNSLFVDWLDHELGMYYKLFFHKELSANDENISFGQMVVADNKIESVKADTFDNIIMEVYPDN